MNVFDLQTSDALSVDELIAELQSAKAAGDLMGSDKVVFGLSFMTVCDPVKSVIIESSADGTRTVGLSVETELEWSMNSRRSDMLIHDRNEPGSPGRPGVHAKGPKP